MNAKSLTAEIIGPLLRWHNANGYTNIEEYLHTLATDSYICAARCMSADMR